MYKIQYAKGVQKDLCNLPKVEINKVLKKIESLSKDPKRHGVEALKGSLKGLYRLRSGDYRIVFQIIEGKFLILVVRVANRKEVYE